MSFDFASTPKEDAPCPLCGGRDFEPLASIDRYWMGVRTVACRACGMITTSPRPVEAALDAFYRDHYRTVYAKVVEPSQAYIHANGVDERADYVALFLAAEASLPASAKVLDVGCAEGSILRSLRKQRPDVEAVGIEPGPKFAAFAREYAGIEVVPGMEAAPRHPYDLIVVNHVLEHVIDPISFLKGLRERLGPAGRIFVDVPDAAAYADINDLHLAHLHHFTISTLARVAARAGLRQARIEAHRPPHHPASIRAIFTAAEVQTPDLSPTKADLAAAQRIRAINGKAAWYRMRRTLPGRAVHGVARLLARASGS